MSRVASYSSKMGATALPKIEHPLSRLDNPDRISIRGVSRASGRVSSHRPASLLPPPSRSGDHSARPAIAEHLANIPEGVLTVPTANPDNPTLPIFGNRASVSAGGTRASSKMSHLSRPDTQSRIEVDELEMILGDKVRSGGSSLLQAFKNNDPDGRGSVTKDALKHVVSATTGRKLTSKQFYMLLKRMHLDKKASVKYEEFCAYFSNGTTNPAWMDPVAREPSRKSVRSRSATLPTDVEPVKKPKHSPANSARELKPLEIERNTSINIERWLKDKFREGFSALKTEFKREDPDHSGKISRDIFRRVLAQFGLYLRDDASLNMFMARCNMAPRGEVNYVELLNRFQDRSENGIAHNVLLNPNHRFNKEERSASPRSTVTAVEARLLTMFQSDFLSLLGMFHKIDKHSQDVISQQEFRAAIESRFHLDLNDEDFEIFLEHVPLDENGQVRYAEFMAQFDTKKDVKSLWDGKSCVTEVANKATTSEIAADKARTVEDLHTLLRVLVKTSMAKLDGEFHELDEFNSGKLTQEMLYQLLLKMNIKPTVTRGEIRRLWDTFIVNKNRTLSFLQFVRHYGYSLKSSSFPNAKLQPPQRGDNDFMIRSRKLNCAADMLEDNLRAKVDYMWESLRRDFLEMDPYRTGFVSREEFSDVLRELCVHLTNREVEIIANKFDTRDDGRVSYFEFLRPFAMRRQLGNKGSSMLSVMTQGEAELPLFSGPHVPQKGLGTVTSKLKQQLAGDWRTLRRAFQKMDVSSGGTLSLPEFRSVLKLCNVVLDEDEVYHVLSQYDSNLSGNLDYKKFLRDSVSRLSSSRTSSAK